MLTGCDDEVQLPQNDLIYVGFRLAALGRRTRRTQHRPILTFCEETVKKCPQTPGRLAATVKGG